MSDILLITPPFTQLNAPYPAAPALARYLTERGHDARWTDASLLFALRVYSREGLRRVMDAAQSADDFTRSVWEAREAYIHRVDTAVGFLQNADYTTALRITSRTLLPEADPDATDQLLDGAEGITERARIIATVFLADIARFIAGTIDPAFGLSRYGERLAQSPPHFGPVNDVALTQNIIAAMYRELIAELMERHRPRVIAVSVPFPGTLVNALRALLYAREHSPGVITAMGGGWVNTELRNLSDPALFDFCDYLMFDDGEVPLERLLAHTRGEIRREELVRTWYRIGDSIMKSGNDAQNIPFAEAGWPCYTGCSPASYLMMSDNPNPMLSLWNASFQLKLTAAHGCYWKRCAFCDTSLDYVSRFEPLSADELYRRMTALAAETGRTVFHFTDEALPPRIMKELSLRIIREGSGFTWWGNVRFEPVFTEDFARLLALGGCVGLSGGLEGAHPRVLDAMKKGIALADAVTAAHHLSRAGILVHAYCIYGFPGQSEQEITDAVELLRQLFCEGMVHSAYFHQFALTRHSACGLHPREYGIPALPPLAPFANNDVPYAPDIDCERIAAFVARAVHAFNRGYAAESTVAELSDGALRSTLKKNAAVSLVRPREDTGTVYFTARAELIRGTVLRIIDEAGTEELGATETEAATLARLLNDCRIADGAGMALGEFDAALDAGCGAARAQSTLWRKIRATGTVLIV